ncbi:MAG: hypothetical protein H8E37_03350 [Planctomycetes bacterium]|nr:hypothetical protein [Planctomycetota bacterium]
MNSQRAGEIAAEHGRENGLATFSIDVVAPRTTNDGSMKREWVVSLRFDDSILSDIDHAIVIVDDETEVPRLIRSL